MLWQKEAHRWDQLPRKEVEPKRESERFNKDALMTKARMPGGSANKGLMDLLVKSHLLVLLRLYMMHTQSTYRPTAMSDSLNCNPVG